MYQEICCFFPQLFKCVKAILSFWAIQKEADWVWSLGHISPTPPPKHLKLAPSLVPLHVLTSVWNSCLQDLHMACTFSSVGF